MGAAGLLEDGLLLLHPSHKVQKRRSGNREGAAHRRGGAADLAHRLLGAQSATGIGHLEVAPASPFPGGVL